MVFVKLYRDRISGSQGTGTITEAQSMDGLSPLIIVSAQAPRRLDAPTLMVTL